MKITDLEYLNNTAEVLNNNRLSKIEVCDGEMKIVLEKNTSGTTQAVQLAPAPPEAAIFTDKSDAPTAAQGKQTGDYIDVGTISLPIHEVTAPIVGVFYSAPSPEAEPFVTIGSTVKAGDILCVIEAMKCFNEIPATQDGKIVDICLKNGEVAEFGQVLFKLQGG